ncbi:MAG: adenylyl-sulfate kinase [Candidatus Thiodiazotropha weberae]|uniref:Adenylyl-sulfate kinase n=1 Tax=Candidatus Thiodiazotropha endoloripes TaxID=1818881 RepID=A0A1E2UR37_9GAMM|nr:adenylyl-sulfate kinase [Candidatus Thiodiazotropha endoloripes]MCG7896833.1 adenylyl-sulfate kinase [Candidatus Thiodiazotropha weberae]MCG7904057.1 adenylyl-sulfate kinase [Candidatus Thiodiazotropha weberae]ODB86090.1 adenylyl-sulfate kinase [Candidatus Thiodiazotropha endoloripes]ODB88123.1 adenylyl-sulfate kinase [Candidatus Thiodiazotropha endoloripes]ODB89565.1 adenylyl-sulfate kinase [Candidatus Thiodiazotropha endoloripes]
MDDNIVWHQATVTRDRREKMNLHRAKLLWFTGLSGSGKSTLAHALEERLHQRGCRTYVFDGDNVRHGLCNDLGFSIEDRTENIRRIGEMSKLFVDAGVIALTAFISPIREDRNKARELFAEGDFIEVYIRASIETCESRDVKGLYKKAREGVIKNFTGISSPYEEPENPEIVVDTENREVDECVDSLLAALEQQGVIPNVVV